MKKWVLFGLMVSLTVSLVLAGGSKEQKWDRSGVVMRGTDTTIRA